MSLVTKYIAPVGLITVQAADFCLYGLFLTKVFSILVYLYICLFIYWNIR